METNEELQIHFQALDKTQTKKSEQRVKKRAETIRQNTHNQPCQTCTNTQKESSYFSGLIETYLAKLREAGEKAAQLSSCLQEKDAEVERLKQKLSERQLKFVELGGESVAARITELAKKNKQLCVEVDREKSKSVQSHARIQELEKQAAALKRDAPKKQRTIATDCCRERETIRLLQEKLTASEQKAMEHRNKVLSLQQELKVAHKVVVSEVGKDVSFLELLNCPVGFKGRAEQIQTLQFRVQQLEKQKERTDQTPTTVPPVRGKWSTGTNRHQERYHSKLQDMQKEKNAAAEKLSADYEAIKTDHQRLKQAVEVSRARATCLTRELEAAKAQLNALRVKSEHDRELVEALMNQEKCLQEQLTKANKENAEQKEIVVTAASRGIHS